MLARRRLVRFLALATFIALVAFSLWLADVGNVAVVVPVMLVAYLIAASYELLAWRSDAAMARGEQPATVVETAPPPADAFEPPAAPGPPLPEPEAPGPASAYEPDPLLPQPDSPEPEPEPEPEPAPEPEPQAEPEAAPEPPPPQHAATPVGAAPPPRPRFSLLRRRRDEAPAPAAGEPPAEPAERGATDLPETSPSERKRPRLVPLPPREPAQAQPAHEAPPAVATLPRRSEPREWNLWELQRLARDATRREPSRAEEFSYLFVHLRGFAGADGALPREFDGLVRESFGELLEPLESA